MNIKIFSLFPEMFEGPLGSSLIGKAREKDILHIDVVNFRDYSTNKHKSVDDYPFGGGAGMVLQPEPIVSALRDHLDLNDPDTEVILMSPQGKPFTQEDACALAKKKQQDQYKAEILNKYGDKFGNLVIEGKVCLGMSKEMCLEALGYPCKENSSETALGKIDIWTYDCILYNAGYIPNLTHITFTNGKISGITKLSE